MAKYGKKAQQKVKRAMHERKTRNLEERAVRQKGDEPKTSDCDRPFRGSSRRRQGSAQEI